MIIFTSDNGGLDVKVKSTKIDHNSSGPLRGHKGNIYEGGHRVPMIVRYDGAYPRNEARSHIVGINDIFSTICEVVGIDIPKDDNDIYGSSSAQDSISFANYLFSAENVEGLRVRQSTWMKQMKRGSESIQDNEWKLVHSIKNNDNKTFSSRIELYNLKNDIGEKKDESGEEKHQPRIKDMMIELRAKGPCPRDHSSSFILGEGSNKGDMVDCSFFRKRKAKNCEKYPNDGEKYCPSICGRFKPTCWGMGHYWLDKNNINTHLYK